MIEPKSYKWKGVDIKVKDLTSQKVLEIYFFKITSPLITKLTRYFPFSLLWQDKRFHYKHKRVTEADDLIIKIAKENGFWFKLLSYDEDDQFLNLYGKFTELKKNLNRSKVLQIYRDKMNNENFYINSIQNGKVKISLMKTNR